MMDHLSDFRQHLEANDYVPVGALVPTASTWGRLCFNGESKSKASGGYQLVMNADGSYFATFGSSKDPLGFRSWRSDQSQELSWEEISAQKVARLAHRKFLETKERERHERIGARLSSSLDWYPDAVDHPYLGDKSVGPHGIKIRPKTGELLIPRFGIDGRIYSIQKIAQKKPGIKSWKGYFKGARGKDLYYPLMAETDEKKIVVLAEGFATAASIREATGLPVVCCFDSGSLVGIAKGMRERYPTARIVVAADNDQWSFAPGKKPRDCGDQEIAGDDARWAVWRGEDRLYNTGVEKARAAAAAAGGAFVLVPDFEATHPGKMTDFNDLAREKGQEHVKLMFDRAIEIPVVAAVSASVEAGGGGFGGPQTPDVQPHPAGDVEPLRRAGDMGLAFRVLGYNHGQYYYYPFALRQIVALSAAGHTMQNLMQLDNLEAWEKKWRDNDGKLMAKHQTISLYAADNMMKIAKSRGVFVEESHVRGAGTWIDEGRVMMHCGDTLYVEGSYMRFDDVRSEFTYVAAPKLLRPARDSLGNHDARRLRRICEAITWENPLSGTLLAGWMVVAPICGALGYRPHIYITGEAESGKSTVMDKIIKPVLGKIALCVDGGTTEPSIRDMMGYDARPLVYDEAEPSPSMVEVIGLARKASTGAVVKKFGQRAFKARFCACFSAINPPVNKTADESRISFMHIKKNRKATAMQEYDDLLQMIDETIGPDFSEKLIARTLENMDTLISNIRIFQRAVRKTIGGARAAQQIGTMMAGVYLLGRTDTISDKDALELVQRYSWTDHTIVDQEGDPIRLVQWIVGSLIKTRSGIEVSIGELVSQVKYDRDVSADKLLRYYGIAVRDDTVDIASRSQNLAKLLKDTEWHDKWSRTLSDVNGAVKIRIAYFSPGIKTSATTLPIDLFIAQEEMPPPADKDWWGEEERTVA